MSITNRPAQLEAVSNCVGVGVASLECSPVISAGYTGQRFLEVCLFRACAFSVEQERTGYGRLLTIHPTAGPSTFAASLCCPRLKIRTVEHYTVTSKRGLSRL